MSGNAQKTPFAASLSEFTEKRIKAVIAATGRGLPASAVSVQAGRGVVTVKFELTNTGITLPNVTIPLFGPEWIRYPLAAGTKGVVIPFDASIGNMSGLGAQTSNLAPTANLSSLVFLPIGNAGWEDPEEPNRTVIYGPDGVVLRSLNKTWSVRVFQTGAQMINADGTVFVAVVAGKVSIRAPVIELDGAVQMNGNIQNIGGGTYSGNFITTGTIQSGTIPLGTHKHTGVTTGGGTSGGPTP